MSDTFRQEYQVLSPEEKLAMRAVKEAGNRTLETLELYMAPGRELSLAKTKLEEMVMWAVKGITG
jgi:hypothetical protein